MTTVRDCPCCEWAGAHSFAAEYRHCPMCGELLMADELGAPEQ